MLAIHKIVMTQIGESFSASLPEIKKFLYCEQYSAQVPPAIYVIIDRDTMVRQYNFLAIPTDSLFKVEVGDLDTLESLGMIIVPQQVNAIKLPRATGINGNQGMSILELHIFHIKEVNSSKLIRG